MWPDRVLKPGHLTYKSGALPSALRGPAIIFVILNEFSCLKRKNLVFICSDETSQCFYAARCNFLHKFEQSLS